MNEKEIDAEYQGTKITAVFVILAILIFF